MHRFWIVGLLTCLPLLAQAPNPCASGAPEIAAAFNYLYNFNFPAAHAELDRYIAAHPDDPLPYSVRAAAYLFYELDRLEILESQFLTSDKRIAEKKGLSPDPNVRAKLMQALNDATTRAEAVLKAHPNDREALFSMTIVNGVTTDYMALVEKRQLASLSPAKKSNSYAQQLLKMNPPCYDAYMTAGLSEYMIASLPFLIRWFVRFDNVQGSKQQGIKNLELVARNGYYLRAFAKILLGIIDLREKRPRETEKLLAELAHDYPSNPLFRKELARLSTHSASGGGQN